MSEEDHSAGHRPRNGIAELVSVKEDLQDDLLAIPGVVSVGLGYKRSGGHITRELAIVAFVQEKRTDLPRDECVPVEVGGVPTDVVEIGRAEIVASTAAVDNRRYDPMVGGCSIGSCRSFARRPTRRADEGGGGWGGQGPYYANGTFGVLVVDRASNSPMLLSCFHVLCPDLRLHQGDGIAQPSRGYGG